jgi:hypothetical protein
MTFFVISSENFEISQFQNTSGMTSIVPVYPALAKQRMLVVLHSSLFP